MNCVVSCFWSKVSYLKTRKLPYWKSSVAGKECYQCRSSNDVMDTCGDFDSSSPKCSVADDVDCYKSTVTA